MAALLLSVAGGSVGGTLFGSVGAIAGRLAGALVGNAIDQSLFASRRDVAVEGPRLSDLTVMASTEGAPIPRVYGRTRLSGQVIWATNLEEVVTTSTETSGGGGGKGMGGGATVSTTRTTYSYFANFAVGLCEGPIGAVMRVWADGKPLDLSSIAMRVYVGDETQTADPLIVAKEGDTPAYRGVAYVVFERLALENFGNRIPQLSFEVLRPVGELERMTRAVTLIPGSTEFGYEPATVTQQLGPGQSAPENRHISYRASDVIAALDDLQATCPLIERVAIVLAWFGTDLRCDKCRIVPAVDNRAKSTNGATWSVAGVNRSTARLVSLVDGRPAYGGTPSDQSVRNLIAELKRRGLKVTLYPFVMMDIPTDNTLPNPWTGAVPQPAFPWRGRITCDPAPGQVGSPDGTSIAADQVNAFFTGGSDGWNYRNFILHYANLVDAAGGVDAFLLGSELKALTRVRSGSGVYPAVDALTNLAGEVKAIVGAGTVVTYGADWTEYGAHVVDAAAHEMRFPLDKLWASPSIGAIGIDYYAPLADWRGVADEADRAVTNSPYAIDYLSGNLARGEAYDWFYADDAARTAQIRTPITDDLGKPWVFRQKDIWNFWSQPHYERVGGVELAAPTLWVPESKPIWLTEVGCPAVDKGANQPSVFPDAKSSENGLPYFSNGRRDDLMQRRHLQSVLGAFDPAFGDGALNPVSAVYGGRMIDASAIHLWTWDARPFPVFPAAADVWSDAANWETGHWLTGRFGGAPLDALVPAILSDCGISNVDANGLGEGPDGYLVDRPMAPRATLDPLALAFAFDATEDGGILRFRARGGDVVAEIDEDALALTGDDGAPAQLTRAQETDLPRQVSLTFTNIASDYQRAAVMSRRLVGGSARVASADIAMTADDAEARRRADIWLQDLWAGREAAAFALPLSRLALAPGDVIGLTVGGRRRLIELQEVTDTESRAITARTIDPEVFDLALPAAARRAFAIPAALGPAHALTLDLPTLDDKQPPVLMRVAVFADPWPGAMAVWAAADGVSFQRAALVAAPATVGQTLDDLPAGPTARWHNSSFRVQLYGGVLSSRPESAVLSGANAAALQRADGAWEIIQFVNAELVGERTYMVSRLLRGQLGSEWAMGAPLAAGSPFVLLDANLVPTASGADALERPLQLRIVAANRDIADASAVALEATPQATALRPLAPVHVSARRGDDGVTFSWIRRARFDGDSWVGEVPLCEASEEYNVDILSGDSVVRTLGVSSPSALYAAGDELADFGMLQSSLTIRVTQLSATVGRGFATRATLAV
ncbi:MAG TPA: glycoside hydrolase/phage tail family protein [Pseudolabrys sp.]|nr:glycoside hydrolase/phage tail family protein [Pseudolabrys sp.]